MRGDTRTRSWAQAGNPGPRGGRGGSLRVGPSWAFRGQGAGGTPVFSETQFQRPLPTPRTCQLGPFKSHEPQLRDQNLGNLLPSGVPRGPRMGRACLTTGSLNQEGRGRLGEWLSEKAHSSAVPNFCKILFPPRLLQTTRLKTCSFYSIPSPAYA